jgi:hypothetical protein
VKQRVGVHSHSLAFEAMLQREGLRVYLILNTFWRPLVFELPPIGDGGPWRRWIDTALESLQDVVPADRAGVARCYLSGRSAFSRHAVRRI